MPPSVKSCCALYETETSMRLECAVIVHSHARVASQKGLADAGPPVGSHVKDQSAVERLVQRRGKRYAKLMGKGILSSWLVVVMVCALIRVVGKGF